MTITINYIYLIGLLVLIIYTISIFGIKKLQKAFYLQNDELQIVKYFPLLNTFFLIACLLFMITYEITNFKLSKFLKAKLGLVDVKEYYLENKKLQQRIFTLEKDIEEIHIVLKQALSSTDE